MVSKELKYHLALLFGIIGIVAFYYAPFINNFFSYDDFRYIENNSHGIKQLLLGYNTFRPISNGVWSPLYLLSGFNPIGYSLFSMTLVCINGFLAYFFLLKLFQNRLFAFLSGILFVASGVGADAILWKCASNSLIAFFFYLITLNFYIIFRQSGKPIYFPVALMFFLFAMLSKEDAASLPFVILLIELVVFEPGRVSKNLIIRVSAFAAVVLVCLLLGKLLFFILQLPPELNKFYKIRPLHSMFSGFTSFFLEPNGFLNFKQPLFYCSVIALPAAFVLSKDRRLLLFALGWIFLTFLPQSLTSLGQFEPKYLFNSMSRYLYIVSLGPAMVYAALLSGLRRRLPDIFSFSLILLFMLFFVWSNHANVEKRGFAWREDAAPVEVFLPRMKQVMPTFPPNSYIYVENAPTGRAYVQQSMRAYYQNPSITWIGDPTTFVKKPGDSAFLILVEWGHNGVANIFIEQPW